MEDTKRPSLREVANERAELERWDKAIAICFARPGRGKTKWAILTAHLKGAVVVVRKDSLSHTRVLREMAGIGPRPPRVISYDGLSILSKLDDEKKVVLDDYLESFESGEVEGVQELEERYGVTVVAITITFTSREEE